MEEKFSDVPKVLRVGPKKVGSVGLPETGHFFALQTCYLDISNENIWLWNGILGNFFKNILFLPVWVCLVELHQHSFMLADYLVK